MNEIEKLAETEIIKKNRKEYSLVLEAISDLYSEMDREDIKKREKSIDILYRASKL